MSSVCLKVAVAAVVMMDGIAAVKVHSVRTFQHDDRGVPARDNPPSDDAPKGIQLQHAIKLLKNLPDSPQYFPKHEFDEYLIAVQFALFRAMVGDDPTLANFKDFKTRFQKDSSGTKYKFAENASHSWWLPRRLGYCSSKRVDNYKLYKKLQTEFIPLLQQALDTYRKVLAEADAKRLAEVQARLAEADAKRNREFAIQRATEDFQRQLDRAREARHPRRQREQ